jgi:hypothetical protein
MTSIAEVRLQIPRWPRGACGRMLRGALCTELERHRPGLHIDWHGHAEVDTRDAYPPISYRGFRRPSVWMMGPRTEEHLRLLMQLSAIRLDRDGDILEVGGMDVQHHDQIPTVSNKRWRRYELETPLYPPDVAWRRRPREAGPERCAWAGQLLRASLAELGLDAHVHIHAMEDRPVEWRGERRRGFVARWVSNAGLPDGIGIGAHKAEGWGVVRCH